MKLERAAGVLLHATCLPSPFGIGDLGPAAHHWLDWLDAAGVRWWQVLPLNPTGPGFSPYSATSTFAGNPLLISPELLAEEGLLTRDDLDGFPGLPTEYVAWERLVPAKERLLRKAWNRLVEMEPGSLADELEAFSREQGWWLEEFALFDALKRAHGGAPWYEWPDPFRRHDGESLRAWADANCMETGYSRFCQLLFFRQWTALKAHAGHLGIRILGDVPIFVSLDSAEVWSRRELFRLDEQGNPTVVAGVPPDYFSETGQRWGNPLYDWDRHAADGYAWWIARLRQALTLCDAVRLDHFRGFAAHWEIPAEEETAVMGRWVPGPGRALFEAVEAELGDLPFVAEDLGTITEEVRELRRVLGLPGMAILHFAFNPSPRSTYIPYNHTRDLVVYTGTHDNNTTVGWWSEDATEGERELVRRYIGGEGWEIHWDLIRLALSSVARLAIVPHQDLAGLGSDCRMNTPGRAEGNWGFRITPWMLDEHIRDRLAGLIGVYGRDGAA
ncbi:MAG: 4-alpha-glucanotransferase [Acidobacteria bacterium]|nr:4-alpha-glucanotransferase [Acidobacteriota bacterium]